MKVAGPKKRFNSLRLVLSGFARARNASKAVISAPPGSVVAPIVSGWTIDRTGSYSGAFMLALVGSVVSILLLIPVMRFARSTKAVVNGT